MPDQDIDMLESV